MRKFLIIATPIGVFVLLFLTVGFLSSNAPRPEQRETEERAVSVIVEEVRRETITPHVTTQGEVRARTEIDLVTQISGRIDMVAEEFVEGGIFEQGEVLIQIEDDDYRLAVVSAQARVADAQQLLLREEAESEMARQDWEELGEGDPTALTLREPQLAQAQANLAAAKANLQTAELNLKRTRISVPFSGRVRTTIANVGQFVSPGARLGRVFSTDIVEIRLPLTDRELGILRLPIGYEAPEEDRIEVELSATVGGVENVWKGFIARTDSAIDSDTRVLYCIIEVQDPYGQSASDIGVPLAVGLFVSADIPGKPIENVLVIPREALRSGQKVMVVTEEDRLDIRTVSIDFTETDRVVLKGGVEPGERVIVGALESPVQNMKLEPLTVEEAAAARSAEVGGERTESGDAT